MFEIWDGAQYEKVWLPHGGVRTHHQQWGASFGLAKFFYVM